MSINVFKSSSDRENSKKSRCADTYFPFVNGRCHFLRSMPPLLTKPLVVVDVICSLRENDFDSQVEFTFQVMEKARVTCY